MPSTENGFPFLNHDRSVVQGTAVAAELYKLSFNGALLFRGFWLYVWEIVAPDGRTIHYVGKTGDKASRVSQSPFNRLSNHVGGNKRSNALRRYLDKMRIDPARCQFHFYSYGPLFFDSMDKKTHGELCDVTSGLEKALANAMTDAGYTVMNPIHCRSQIDFEIFAVVRASFGTHFDKLLPTKSVSRK
jgi:hypothetical protein